MGHAILNLHYRKEKHMRALSGSYDHSVDAKNRIRIPAKLKADLLGEPVEPEDSKEPKKFNVVFHLGTGGCIEVYSEEEVEKIYSRFADVKQSDTEKYKAVSIFLSTFEPVESDPQGRLVIPPMCRKYAKIEKDVKICGRRNHIEIWSPERYDEFYGTQEMTVEGMADLVKILDF